MLKKIIISSKNQGSKEIIINNFNGYLLNLEKNKFVNKIKNINNNAIKINNLNKTLKKYSIDESIKKYIKVINQF